MSIKLADKVRAMALQKYVQPAKRAGMKEFSIPVRDLQKKLESDGFPLNYTPLVCNSIKTKTFQRENNMEITRVDGPKSKTGTRVVVHCRFLRDEGGATARSLSRDRGNETPSARAARVTESLRGLLKQEMASFGGADAFIRWVRSDDEDAA